MFILLTCFSPDRGGDWRGALVSVFVYCFEGLPKEARIMGLELTIDVSDLDNEIKRLQMVMKPEKFDNAMAGILRRTSSHVKKILKTDLPIKYNVKGAEVGRAVKSAKMSAGVIGGVGCTIPVVAARKSIGGGGRGFTAYSRRIYGWKAVTAGHYDVSAQIYKGIKSKLPSNMPGPSYFGYPPFRNMPGSKLGTATFTRTGEYYPKKKKGRYPIVAVKGIAIPQMPMNRAKDEVEKDIKEYMQRQIEHRIQRIIAGGK